MKQFDFAAIAELDIWARDFPPPDTASVFVSQEVGLAAVVAVTDVLTPQFVQVDDAILMDGNFSEETYRGWRKALGDDFGAIERVVNHLHVWELISPQHKGENVALDVFAERLAITWRAAASAQFPDRTFFSSVELDDDDGPEVTIFSHHAQPTELTTP